MSISPLDSKISSLHVSDGLEHDSESSLNEASLSAPEAAEVRKQLDYYFSDDNLKTDKFLLGKMRGRKNRPVPVKIIHSFRKMQRYQPFSAVVAVLKECKNVDLVKETGIWCVQRKVPFVLDNVQALAHESKPIKQKPTGFEEFYADGPTTAVDAEEEQSLYHESRSVMERVETALQRYQAKRKFSNRLKNVFDKWLRFGGVEAGQKMFSGGLDPAFVKESSAADIAAMTATSYIGDDKKLGQFDQTWAIAFEDVGKSFLSIQVPIVWDWEQYSNISECTNMLRNFYNYLLHHEVCPEYRKDILAARNLSEKAEKELLATNRALGLLPGDFNVACSSLFGGQYHGLHAGSRSWMKESEAATIRLGLSEQRIVQVFKFGIAQYASEAMFDTAHSEKTRNDYLTWHIVKTEEGIGLEVSCVIRADVETQEIYNQSPGKLKSLGKLKCRAWTPPDFAQDDLPPGVSSAQPQQDYELYVEDEVLAWLCSGTKLEATVCTLSSGLQFFDSVRSVKCSFYKPLENDMVLKFREPRTITRDEQLAREQAGEADDDEGGGAIDLD